jgi:hypothetical protein
MSASKYARIRNLSQKTGRSPARPRPLSYAYCGTLGEGVVVAGAGAVLGEVVLAPL